jgi:dienelactone hydrolase
MRAIFGLVLVSLVGVCGCQPKAGIASSAWKPNIPGATAENLTAKDGTRVYAEYLKAESQPAKGVILLFHQARSNSAEYAPIAPRLAKLGYDCLALNQRSGGDMFGGTNPTAAESKGSKEYMDAYQDLQASVDWAVKKGYKKMVAWGSSYSASLAIRLGAERDEVGAVFAFSPGEYLPEKGIVAKWNASLSKPEFICSTEEEKKREVSAIFDSAPTARPGTARKLFVPKKAVHGASTLMKDKNPDGSEDAWSQVENFLKGTVDKL